METYEWKKNKAVVDRMYYTERILEVTTFLAGTMTATEALYIQKNYFANQARRRIPRVRLSSSICLVLDVVGRNQRSVHVLLVETAFYRGDEHSMEKA